MPYPETFEAVGIVDYDKWKEPQKFTFKNRSFKDDDLDIKIDCCGVCGSDVHGALGHWGRPYAPVAFGHEIIGHVVKAGPKAKKGIKVGDRVGVGAQCDCCGKCIACHEGHDNNCLHSILTYFGVYKDENFCTQGGDASHIRVNSQFAFKIPDNLESEYVAPLLCGGITGTSPLFQHNVGKGSKVGVVALGGIGHMTLLFAKALGAEVTVISRSRSKEADAKAMGADHYIPMNEPETFEKAANTLDLIVNTSSSLDENSVDRALTLLKPRGTFAFITAPPASEKLIVTPMKVIMGNYQISGSAVGSTEEIERLLKLASEKNVKPWVQKMPLSEANLSKAWQNMDEGKVRYRITLTDFDKFFQ